MYNTYMQYLAILGRQPEIGLLELQAVLGEAAVQAFGSHAQINTSPNLAHLGGSLKIVKVLGELTSNHLSQSLPDLDQLPLRDGKTQFGVSIYAPKVTHRDVLAYGLALKKRLKERGSVRFNEPKAPATELSAASLKFNKVLENGFELVLVGDGHKTLWGLTEQVQDVDWYSRRDYDRPARSAKIGMLPPKLAQILVNLSGGEAIYDPFCGTGVVLQEALLMGKGAGGSDLNPEMVEATRANLAWLAGQTSTALSAWQVTESDATSVKIPSGYNISSEGYLGPHLEKAPTAEELAILKADMKVLLERFLKNAAGQLKSEARLTICLPAWRIGKCFVTPDIVDSLPVLGYTFNQFAASDAIAPPPVYWRTGQIVGRMILTLRKI